MQHEKKEEKKRKVLVSDDLSICISRGRFITTVNVVTHQTTLLGMLELSQTSGIPDPAHP
jgi:hypothetical protein